MPSDRALDYFVDRINSYEAPSWQLAPKSEAARYAKILLKHLENEKPALVARGRPSMEREDYRQLLNDLSEGLGEAAVQEREAAVAEADRVITAAGNAVAGFLNWERLVSVRPSRPTWADFAEQVADAASLAWKSSGWSPRSRAEDQPLCRIVCLALAGAGIPAPSKQGWVQRTVSAAIKARRVKE